MRTEDFFSTYFGFFSAKQPNKKEELALGLTYGDVTNAYERWNISSDINRIRLTKAQKNEVVEYMKERYKYWLQKLTEKGVDER